MEKTYNWVRWVKNYRNAKDECYTHANDIYFAHNMTRSGNVASGIAGLKPLIRGSNGAIYKSRERLGGEELVKISISSSDEDVKHRTQGEKERAELTNCFLTATPQQTARQGTFWHFIYTVVPNERPLVTL